MGTEPDLDTASPASEVPGTEDQLPGAMPGAMPVTITRGPHDVAGAIPAFPDRCSGCDRDRHRVAHLLHGDHFPRVKEAGFGQCSTSNRRSRICRRHRSDRPDTPENDLRKASQEFVAASGMLDSPILSPAAVLPVVGRQVTYCSRPRKGGDPVSNIGIHAVGTLQM